MTTFFDLMKNIVNTLNAVVRIDSQTLTDEEKATVLSNISAASQAEADKLREDVDNLLYKDIQIISMTSFDVKELGDTVNTIEVEWELNRDPVMQTINDSVVDVTLRAKTFTDLTTTTEFELKVTGEKDETASLTKFMYFYNGVYYGAAGLPDTIDDNFVLSLEFKELSDTRERIITVTSDTNQYIWYILPVRLGTCSFAVDGFAGGFDLIDTIDFTNRFGYIEPYYIYRTNQTGLGETKVVVS